MGKQAFVLIPFAPEFDAAYRLFILPALEEAGFTTSRADDVLNQRNILQDVVSGIVNADIVVADLTGSNANVFYELGIAHALEKPTILLTQSVEELPFDLRSYRVLAYQTHFARIDHAKIQLIRLAQSAYAGTALFGNPVTDFHARTQQEPKSEEAYPTDTIATSAPPDDDRGFIDHLIDILEGSQELGQLLSRVKDATSRLNPETQDLAAGIGRANATGGALAATQIRALCQRYAGQLGNYTAELQQVNEEYEKVADRMQDSLEFVVRASMAASGDSSQIAGTREALVSARASAVGARDAFSTAREGIASVLGFERSLRRAGLAAIGELDRLVSNISKTISSFDRGIDAAGGQMNA